MAMPWGVLTDPVECAIYDFYTQGYSVEKISVLCGLAEKVVLGVIRSVPFQADLKLLQDDMQYHELMSPMARVTRLQHKALDVLVDEMAKPNGKYRVVSAQDILDRGRDVPRATRVTQNTESVPAESLSFVAQVLRELGAGLASGLVTTLNEQQANRNAIPTTATSGD
jgi:hypothetical protein